MIIDVHDYWWNALITYAMIDDDIKNAIMVNDDLNQWSWLMMMIDDETRAMTFKTVSDWSLKPNRFMLKFNRHRERKQALASGPIKFNKKISTTASARPRALAQWRLKPFHIEV